MRVLVACEESQAVCKAFRKLGIEAYSCDIQECSGGHPEWHIQGDAVAEAYSGKYDLMIAHPPCTYLSNAAANLMYRGKKLNQERYKQMLEGRELFMKFYNAPIKYSCIENPTPVGVAQLPQYTQRIQPWQFGDPFSKRTLLWLKNLPQLRPTNIIRENIRCWVKSGSAKRNGQKGVANTAKQRSKTFQGIADAMADQWTKYILR